MSSAPAQIRAALASDARMRITFNDGLVLVGRVIELDDASVVLFGPFAMRYPLDEIATVCVPARRGVPA